MSVDEGGLAGPGPRGRPRAGDRIGNYEVIGKLASGGMAELYVAKRGGLEGFQKVVCLKRILPHLAENPEFVEMFLAEARLAATLEHPNIVHVSDIGKESGDFFFTMAYIHGKDLLAILRRCATLRQRFGLPHAITVALQICAGLHHAHEQVDWQGRPLGIVHRDISPANVLVTWHGNVKVVDFGIAKAATQTGVTQVGVRKGKASYMSPEQCNGRDVDRRADIWAIGVVLFEITTMTRLFKADNELAIMHRIVTGDVPMPHALVPDYPPQLAQIVMRCLEIDPERRYPTAQALRRDLETFAHDQRIATSTDALGEYLRGLYPPEAQRLPWTTAAQLEPAMRPQHVPPAVDSSLAVFHARVTPPPSSLAALLGARRMPDTPSASRLARDDADDVLGRGKPPNSSLDSPTRVTTGGGISTPSGPSLPPTDPSAVQGAYAVAGTELGASGPSTTPGVPMPPARPITQPAPSRATVPVPVVDPRGWESGGTTDTEARGPVTHSGVDVGGVSGRPVAAWVAAVAIVMVGLVFAAAWVLWPRDPPTVVVEPPPSAEPAPTGEDLSNEQILVLVNQADPALALDYRRRHVLLDRVRDDPELDTELQTRLDLLQAGDAPDPCAAFEQALRVLEGSAAADDVSVITQAVPPRSCPDAAARLRSTRLRERLHAE